MISESHITAINTLERHRQEALVRQDNARLEEIFHPSLVHVHSHGGVDTYESFLAGGGFKIEYRRIERFDDLRVVVFGDSALMAGRQRMEIVRRATGELVDVQSFVTQMWVLHGGVWRQTSFQATSTPPSAQQSDN